MKTITLILVALALFFVSCEDTSSNNNNSNTTPTTNPTDVETPAEPKEDLPEDTRRPLYLQGLYATSNGESVGDIFDNNPSTTWSTKKGAGSDEGVMLYFQNKTFIKKVEIESAKGSGFANVDNIVLYGNGATIGIGGMDDEIIIGDSYYALFIRFGLTDQETEVKVEASDKNGIVRKFSKSHSVGIQNIKMWDEDGKEFRLIPPQRIKAKITATSTLEPTTAYSTSKLFDNRKEFAWVEGSDGNGINDLLKFEMEEIANIDEVQIWNGYQRSESHYKSNARLKGFSLGESGSKSYEYTLRDDDAGQKIDLTVPLRTKSFELKINSAYDGRSYKDLAISEMLFFKEGKPIQLEVKDDSAEREITQKAKGTILEPLLDYRIANELEYPVSGFSALRSIILRSDGTFVMYLSETDFQLSEEGDSDTFVSIADGNWEILNANSSKATIKIFGKILDTSAIEAYYAGDNEQAEMVRIFKDELTIENNEITGQKILSEIIIR